MVVATPQAECSWRERQNGGTSSVHHHNAIVCTVGKYRTLVVIIKGVHHLFNSVPA